MDPGFSFGPGSIHSSGKEIFGISPKAPTQRKDKTKTVFHQTSTTWRRLSLTSQNGNEPGSPKSRNLVDLTVYELLDVLKSLNVPLKARKCLETVGVSGQDFSYYTERDLNQIGICRKDIKEKVMGIRQKLFEHEGRVPAILLQPSSKRERMQNAGLDPFQTLDFQSPHNRIRSRSSTVIKTLNNGVPRESGGGEGGGRGGAGGGGGRGGGGGGGGAGGKRDSPCKQEPRGFQRGSLDLDQVTSKLEAIQQDQRRNEEDKEKEDSTSLPEIAKVN